MVSMIDTLRARAANESVTHSAGMSANHGARIAKVNVFAALGGSTAEETNHVRNLAAHLCAPSNTPMPQQGSRLVMAGGGLKTRPRKRKDRREEKMMRR